MGYTPITEEEKIYLSQYDPSRYDRPSVSVDIVAFTILPDTMSLGVLFIKRNEHPYKGRWSLPGGFVGIDESLEDTVKRKLVEKTGIMDLPFHQLKSFGNVDRDPRMRVISVAYMSFVPLGAIQCSRKLGYDDVKLFSLEEAEDGMVFISRDPKSQTIVVKERELAFDHAEMVRTALKRLRGRIDYTDDAFAFLDRTSFTVYQLKSIYEAVKGKYLDAGNFRRDFKKKYEDTGRAEKTGETRGSGQGRPAPLYRIKRTEGEWT